MFCKHSQSNPEQYVLFCLLSPFFFFSFKFGAKSNSEISYFMIDKKLHLLGLNNRENCYVQNVSGKLKPSLQNKIISVLLDSYLITWISWENYTTQPMNSKRWWYFGHTIINLRLLVRSPLLPATAPPQLLQTRCLLQRQQRWWLKDLSKSDTDGAALGGGTSQGQHTQQPLGVCEASPRGLGNPCSTFHREQN